MRVEQQLKKLKESKIGSSTDLSMKMF